MSYHFCDECVECATCEGGALRFPRHWKLGVRGNNELFPICSTCDGHGFVHVVDSPPIPATDRTSP